MMYKKTLSIVLSLLLCLTCVISAFASVTYLNAEEDIGLVQYIDDPNVTGTVYISISEDDRYVESDGPISGEIMAYVPVALADLQFDLCDYGLDSYICDLADYDPDAYGRQPITLMHLYVYTLENYYSGGWNVNVTGGAGSSYLQYGFWGHDENLTYYVNGVYPLEGEGWGATSDRICLTDGDFVDLTMYTSWAFWMDSAMGYHYFLDENGEITHSFTLNAGEELTVNMCRTGADMAVTYNTAVYEENDYPFYYSSVLYDDGANEAYSGETISFDEPGTYYLWADGGYGEDYPDDIVSSPAYAIVEVLGGTTPVDPDAEAAAAVDALIDAIGDEITLESENAITAARNAYEDLTAAQQLLVTKLQKLIDAEEALEELQIAAANAAAAADVDALIDEIGTVTLESEAAIAQARAAYNALTDAQKALVTRLNTLTAAEDALAALQAAAAEAAANAAAAAEVDAKIDAIGNVTLNSESAIAVARAAYNALTDAQKALVTKLGTLTAAESTLSQLQAAAQEEKLSDNDQQSGKSFWDKILDFFRRIISFFQNIFKR